MQVRLTKLDDVVAVLLSSRQDAKGIKGLQLQKSSGYRSALLSCIQPFALDLSDLCLGSLSKSFLALFCIFLAFVHPLSSFPPHNGRSVRVRMVKKQVCGICRPWCRSGSRCDTFEILRRCPLWHSLDRRHFGRSSLHPEEIIELIPQFPA